MDLLVRLGDKLATQPLSFTNAVSLSLQDLVRVLQQRQYIVCLLQHSDVQQQVVAVHKALQQLHYCERGASFSRSQLLKALESRGSPFSKAVARWRHDAAGKQAQLEAAHGFAAWYLKNSAAEGMPDCFMEASDSYVSDKELLSLVVHYELQLPLPTLLALDLLLDATAADSICRQAPLPAVAVAHQKLATLLQQPHALLRSRRFVCVPGIDEKRYHSSELPAFLFLTLWRIYSFELLSADSSDAVQLSAKQALQLAERMYNQLERIGSLYTSHGIGSGWKQFARLVSSIRWRSLQLRRGSTADALWSRRCTVEDLLQRQHRK